MTQSGAEPTQAANVTDSALSSLQAAGDEVSTVQALRLIKNQLIGNKHKKLAMLQQGGASMIVSAAAAREAPEVWAEAAAALASLAYNQPEAASQICAAQGVQLFRRMLASQHDKAVENAARAWRVVCQVTQLGA
jgi:hypothetical protein